MRTASTGRHGKIERVQPARRYRIQGDGAVLERGVIALRPEEYATGLANAGALVSRVNLAAAPACAGAVACAPSVRDDLAR